MRINSIEVSGNGKEAYTHHGNMFLTGNGAMGVRGTVCEYRKNYMPAINLAAVVYALDQCVRITGDTSVLDEGGYAVSCGLDTRKSKPDPEVFLIADEKLRRACLAERGRKEAAL